MEAGELPRTSNSVRVLAAIVSAISVTDAYAHVFSIEKRGDRTRTRATNYLFTVASRAGTIFPKRHNTKDGHRHDEHTRAKESSNVTPLACRRLSHTEELVALGQHLQKQASRAGLVL